HEALRSGVLKLNARSSVAEPRGLPPSSSRRRAGVSCASLFLFSDYFRCFLPIRRVERMIDQLQRLVGCWPVPRKFFLPCHEHPEIHLALPIYLDTIKGVGF